MGTDRWPGVGWPTEYGGRGLTPAEQFVFFDESMRAGAPVPMLTAYAREREQFGKPIAAFQAVAQRAASEQVAIASSGRLTAANAALTRPDDPTSGRTSLSRVKVRIGVSLAGTEVSGSAGFAAGVDELEERGIDSLWLSELVYSSLIDPFVGMAYALSRTKSLKVGTGVAVLPGRSPILVAKQLVSLARLAPKRVLPVFGLSPARPAERVAFPVPKGQRGAVFDESLELLRQLLRAPRVTFKGEFFDVEDASVGELPSTPLDIWLGGSAPAGLRRVGRYGDGWLASFITPDEAAEGVSAINTAAAESGREVDPDHFGISIPVAFEDPPAALIAAIRARRSDMPIESLIPLGWDAAGDLIGRYVEAGLSKFVVRPAGPTPPADFLSRFVSELGPLQT